MRPVTATPVILDSRPHIPTPLDSHPYILDILVNNVPHAGLLALRTASRPLRDAIDKLLVTHVAVYHSSSMVMANLPDGHKRIPRSNWLDLPELTGAVQVVDMIATQEDEETARIYNVERAEAIRLRRQHRMSNPPPIGPPRCWCNQDTVDTSSFNLYLSMRLKHVDLIRRWRGHRCRQLIKAQRTITFLPAVTVNPTQAFLNGDAGTSSCHIVHIGYTPTPVFQHHNFPQLVDHIIVRIAPPANTDRTEEPAALYSAGQETHPVSTLIGLLARQISNRVAITLVGLERWRLSPYEAYFRSEVKFGLLNCLQYFEHVPEKDAKRWVDRYVCVLTEEEYRKQVGKWWYVLEAHCEQTEV
ncbi:hypothetical protein CspHIS471_0310790 [Cutaneotrichosporon sp. HIS471]|nr:hypothetical protein CspHIS471_0310790 [Cutaneotrichosporon sp. HIS471]